jgi:hypothetical protein
MLAHYILAGATLLVVFVMFLVIARTLNSIINQLIKLEYVIQKEFDLKSELLEVRKLMEERPEEPPPGAGKTPGKPTPFR